MTKTHFFSILFLLPFLAFGQKSIEWVTTTEKQPWFPQQRLSSATPQTNADVVVMTDTNLQVIEGFGGCFNELGWTSLGALKQTDKYNILKELFAPNVGANFTICRMPVGANDFSLDWYSYNETAGDFKMKNFSISNDMKTLVPFVKAALEQNPSLRLWASPWSPPAWMKWNKHYACAATSAKMDKKFQNGLGIDRQGKEGTNMFIQEKAYFKAYALYFSKFIKAYREQGINISTIMPQNEFNSCQIFPSCTWTASGLATFIGSYLGPAMDKLKVEMMFGTMERPNEALVDTILQDPLAAPFIKGVGFQWAGKGAIAGIHQRYPNLRLYQSEQECGDGKNDWKYCCYTWELMKHYISNGANSYLYWNISLPEGGFSRWGWQQNSLVTVDPLTKTYKYNHEYYLLKHLSHYVKPGARVLKTEGTFNNLLAFKNSDSTIVLVAQNETALEKSVVFGVGPDQVKVTLPANSFNTLVVK